MKDPRQSSRLVLSAYVVAVLLFLVSRDAIADSVTLFGGIGKGSPVGTAGDLITINQTTGAGTIVGHPDAIAGLTGLAFDSAGTLYGSTISGSLPPTGPPGRTSTLVIIDPTGGAQVGLAHSITAGGTAISITDLAVQPGTNILFGTSLDEVTFTNSIYTIDSTGAASFKGNTGVTGATLGFAPDGTLYMTSATFDENGVQTGIFLHTLDPNAGTILSTIPVQAPNGTDLFHIGGLAVRPTDGLLFVSARAADVVTEGDVYTLTATGTLTFLGDTGIGEIGDVAFRPAAVPEPATVALLVTWLGILGAARWRRGNDRRQPR